MTAESQLLGIGFVSLVIGITLVLIGYALRRLQPWRIAIIGMAFCIGAVIGSPQDKLLPDLPFIIAGLGWLSLACGSLATPRASRATDN